MNSNEYWFVWYYYVTHLGKLGENGVVVQQGKWEGEKVLWSHGQETHYHRLPDEVPNSGIQRGRNARENTTQTY
jgi:hypothetical protein